MTVTTMMLTKST